MSLVSRRWFLGRAAEATIATSAIVATVAKPANANERDPFKYPAEYVAAMHAIGWRPLAMFQRCKDGSIHRMGVEENGGGRLNIENTWREFHAIQMRTPVQLPCDVNPVQDWWKWVWQHLYDNGARQDVTPQTKIWEGDKA